MIRNPKNTNLRFHSEESYQGFPLQTQHGPLIVEYLDLLYLTVQRALNEHPRVFAFRVDLRFPENFDCTSALSSNRVIERFVESRLRGASDEARSAYHDRPTVAVLANLGMTPQLAAFGVCIAVGHPLAFVWVLAGQVALVVLLVLRRETLRNGAVLQGQPGGLT